MCCLSYENGYYADACKKVPKVGSEVGTPEGTGTVINVNMLKMQVKVKIEQKDSVIYRDFDIADIKFKKGCACDKDDDDDKIDDELKKILD
jgi:cell fate regulator YaaT (PSP1 superfamily)